MAIVLLVWIRNQKGVCKGFDPETELETSILGVDSAPVFEVALSGNI